MTINNIVNQRYQNNVTGWQLGGGTSNISTLVVSGDTATIIATGSAQITFPTTTTTLVGTDTTDTLTNKTISGALNTVTLTSGSVVDLVVFTTMAVAGASSCVADANNDTLTFSGISGVSITTNSATDTLIFATSGVTTSAFSTFAVAGQSSVIADSASDTMTFSAGTGITITTDSSTDTIIFAASGGSSSYVPLPLTIVTGTSQTIVANNAYVASNATTSVAFTLPASMSAQDVFKIVGTGAGGWIVNCNSGQSIREGIVVTNSVTGNVNSTTRYDGMFVECLVADTEFRVDYANGTLNIL